MLGGHKKMGKRGKLIVKTEVRPLNLGKKNSIAIGGKPYICLEQLTRLPIRTMPWPGFNLIT
jgi:hypothetical protein